LLVVLVLMLMWKRVWIWVRRSALVLVFRLSLEERRKVGAFRCIGAFFRHVCCSFFPFCLFLPFLNHSFLLLRVTRKTVPELDVETGNWGLATLSGRIT
jgi:hypothetical protein